MERHKELIYSPRFVGERFDGHSLPFEFLADLQALGKLNTEIAKWLFKQKHSERQRVPRGFTEGISYAITGISDGSAVPQVELASPMKGMFPAEYDEFYKEAPKRLTNAIQCLSEQGDPTEYLPIEILRGLENFGASLREDEHVEFSPKADKKAKYSNAIRKELLLSLSPNKEYTKDGLLLGHVIDLNKEKLTFQLSTLSNVIVGGNLSNELYEDFMDAFSEEEPGKRKAVQLRGSIRYNAYDKPRKIESVSELNIVDSLDIQWQLEKIAQLNSGWFEGQGEAFDPQRLEALLHLFNDLYSREDNPFLYPTPDGGVSAEWENDQFDISLEVKLLSMSAEYHCFNKNDDTSAEKKLNLNEESDWGYLLSELSTRLD